MVGHMIMHYSGQYTKSCGIVQSDISRSLRITDGPSQNIVKICTCSEVQKATINEGSLTTEMTTSTIKWPSLNGVFRWSGITRHACVAVYPDMWNNCICLPTGYGPHSCMC